MDIGDFLDFKQHQLEGLLAKEATGSAQCIIMGQLLLINELRALSRTLHNANEILQSLDIGNETGGKPDVSVHIRNALDRNSSDG